MNPVVTPAEVSHAVARLDELSSDTQRLVVALLEAAQAKRNEKDTVAIEPSTVSQEVRRDRHVEPA